MTGNPEKGAIVCIWAVRLPLWLTNNGNWPGLGAPGRGYGLLSPMARTRRTCRVGAAPTALSGLLLLLLLLLLLRLPQPSAACAYTHVDKDKDMDTDSDSDSHADSDIDMAC
ncbi:GD10962 [Drosophila simulans]|uniref:GD10962 n=1 Tax=Drosophila simulans TaxID=7240 RepID=B4QEC7_DROSI|nr:GD10962 [Drosophila simulans]